MRNIILFIMCNAVTTSAGACSCILIESFCEQVRHSMEWDPEHLVIVRGVVVDTIRVDDYRRDLVLEIRESFHNPQGLQKVRIRDGNFASCGRNLDDYSEGDELIFITSIYGDSELLGHFSSCSPPPLRVDQGFVYGQLTSDKNQKISLNKFRSLDCIPKSNYISLFPNPTNDLLRVVALEIPDASNVKLYIFNAIGQMISEHVPNQEEKNQVEWTIDVRNWPSGIYYPKVVATGNHISVSPLAVVH